MYMYLQKVISKKLFKKLVFCWHLGKVNDENSRIWIRIEIRIRIRNCLPQTSDVPEHGFG